MLHPNLGRPRRSPPASGSIPNPTSAPFSDPGLVGLSLHDADRSDDQRRLRAALGVAATLHLLLFFVGLPILTTTTQAEPVNPARTYSVKPLPRIRIERPEPTPIPDPRKPRRPIPVPATMMPEIVRWPESPPLDLELDLPPLSTGFEIPEPPIGVEAVESPATGPIEVSGEVTPPVKLVAPLPHYTEPARRVRLEGQVVLRAVIDVEGRVTDLEVLRPMPMGLTEAALDAARQWRFEPATLHGRPVSVFWKLTATFRLQ